MNITENIPDKLAKNPAADSTDSPSEPSDLRLKGFYRKVILKSFFFLVGLAILGGGIYLTFSTDIVFKSSELEREKIKLEDDIEMLKDENYILRQKLERIKTDPAYVEDEARKKLGLVRPGEVVYRLAEEPDLADEEPAYTQIPPLKQ